jgi:hypothetical protein
VDKLLGSDAAEDDRIWGTLLEEEEAGVKLEVAEMLWMDLLQDTATCVAELDNSLAVRAAGRRGGRSSSTSGGGGVGSSGLRQRLPV